MRIWPAVVLLTACGDRLSSIREAELAALGLEGAIGRSLDLGFGGFNAASSANIPTQSGEGDHSGTLTIDGQVDQGSSANKGMRLIATLLDYADTDPITGTDGASASFAYTSPLDAPLAIDLSLRDIPDGTLTGTITGDLDLEGDLGGTITLALSLSGALVPDGDATRREDDTTSVTGTVSNRAGATWEVDVVL